MRPLISRILISLLALPALSVMTALGQETIVVRPKEIDDVLVNPGIGFMAFQGFNGDRLNEGLVEWSYR